VLHENCAVPVLSLFLQFHHQNLFRHGRKHSEPRTKFYPAKVADMHLVQFSTPMFSADIFWHSRRLILLPFLRLFGEPTAECAKRKERENLYSLVATAVLQRHSRY